MQTIIQLLNDAGWLANLVGIVSFTGGGVVVFYRFVRPHLVAARIDKAIPTDLERKWNDSLGKSFAKIAIVDDQPADFPTAELKADGYQLQTYRQVTLATTAQLALYDIVFLDMKGIVRDDPENGGMRLIAELRRLNPGQKICAVSSKTFDINATEFFRQADDAKRKPLTAHECRAVINTFIGELFAPKIIRSTALQVMHQLARPRRVEAVTHLRKFVNKEMTLEQLRENMNKTAGDLSLGYRLVNLARAVAHAC